jgi:hypothetical protein
MLIDDQSRPSAAKATVLSSDLTTRFETAAFQIN